jgi:hypothetical protein
LLKSSASQCRPLSAGSSDAEKLGGWRQNRTLVLLPEKAWLWKELYLPNLMPIPTSLSKSTASSLRTLMAFRSLRPASAERLSGLVCHSKKDTLRFRARRAGACGLARAGRSHRPKTTGFCGRMRNPYFHDSPLRASSQRSASIRQRPQKPRQEHDPFGKHVVGGDGGGDDRGGIYDPEGL